MSRIFHKYGALVVQITLPTVPWSNAKSKSPFHFCKTLICPACTMGLYHSLFQIFRFHPGAMYIAIYTSQLYSQRDLFLFFTTIFMLTSRQNLKNFMGGYSNLKKKSGCGLCSESCTRCGTFFYQI